MVARTLHCFVSFAHCCRSKKCVESEALYDFLRATVNKLPAPAPKRARSASGASRAPKRGGPSGESSTADAAAAAAGAAGGSDVPAALAAEQYRPLADVDDDYDAE